MAVLQKIATPFDITTNDTFELGDVSPGLVATLVIEFEKLSGFDGSVVVQGKLGQGPYTGIPYRRLNVAGTVSDGTVVATPITDTGIIAIDASGLHIALVCTGRTTGTLRVHRKPLDG